jgi:hypothetical protein
MTRQEIVKEIQKRLGNDFEVSEAWEDSQEDKEINYVVVRIDDYREER